MAIIYQFWYILSSKRNLLNPPSNFASGGHEPFFKRVPGPPKTFYKVVASRPGTAAYRIGLEPVRIEEKVMKTLYLGNLKKAVS
jgi:hypothetical protein